MPRTNPKYIKLTVKSRMGCMVNIPTGFGISGRDVVPFPTNPKDIEWVRQMMRRDVIDEAQEGEYNFVHGIEELDVPVAASPAPDAEDEDEGEDEVEDDDDLEEEEEGDNYEDLTKKELVDELKVRELSHTGNNATLIKRLRQDDADNA